MSKLTEFIAQLSDISDRYDALFVDLWGCLHNGEKPFPNAVTALQKYRDRGGIVILLTNSPRPRPSVRAQLEQIGVPGNCYDDIASSGDASQVGMAAGLAGNRVYHIGPKKDLSFFTDFEDDVDARHIIRVPLQEAEGIICTGLLDDNTEKPEDYRATLLFAKQKGLKLLCTNPDIQVDRGVKRIYCAGAIAELYTEMGGRSFYFGKPHPPIFDLARRRANRIRPVFDDRVLCIGDGILTDIRGGLAEGMDTLFITGGLAVDELGENPTPSVVDDFFNRHQTSATAAIAALR